MFGKQTVTMATVVLRVHSDSLPENLPRICLYSCYGLKAHQQQLCFPQNSSPRNWKGPVVADLSISKRLNRLAQLRLPTSYSPVSGNFLFGEVIGNPVRPIHRLRYCIANVSLTPGTPPTHT